MTEIKLAVWNMEWLNNLFVSGNGPAAFKGDDDNADREGKTKVGDRLAKLQLGLQTVNADLIVVVEGPNRTEELQLLFDQLAPGTWKTHIQVSKSINGPGRSDTWSSSQCVGVAVRNDSAKFSDEPFKIFDAMNSAEGLIFTASEPFWADSGGDKVPEWYRFERRPLYAEITLSNQERFRILGLHLKSKGIFSAHEWSRWWAMADANRERLIAQCRRLRSAFIDPYLTDTDTRNIPLIVCGDINDGPGFDTSEIRHRTSGFEVLMGSPWHPDLVLGNALFDQLPAEKKAALEFEDISTTSFLDPIFNSTRHHVWIDHILYTRNAPAGWVKDAHVLKQTSDPKTPFYKISDHYPVVATVSL